METVYYGLEGQPGAFSHPRLLAKYANRSVTEAIRFLEAQPAYTLHKQIRRRFKRRRTFVKSIGDLYQADLCDFQNLAAHNDQYKYSLNVIDCFNKKGFAQPLKSKNSAEVANAFETILKDGGIIPTFLQTDKGSEFVSSVFQNMLSRYGIKFYTSEDEIIKASIIERWNRTLRDKIYRFFTYKHTYRWIDQLQIIVRSYNATFHRSIGMAPDDVTEQNSALVFSRLFPEKKPKTAKYTFQIGDSVRITMARLPFQKSYTEGGWSEELFTITDRHPTHPVTYSIKDYLGQSIKGRFYEPELVRVIQSKDPVYVVETILKTRKNRRGQKEHFVKWRGYSSEFNSWVKDKDIKSLT